MAEYELNPMYFHFLLLCATQTAYFEISDKTEHGAELVCSHQTCRNNGIKFRYCAYCKSPMPKRNFKKLHAHKELEENGTKRSTPDTELVHQSLGQTKAMKLGTEESKLQANGVSKTYRGDETRKVHIDTDLLHEWEYLLFKRPSFWNIQEMNGWVNRVIAVSEPVGRLRTHNGHSEEYHFSNTATKDPQIEEEKMASV